MTRAATEVSMPLPPHTQILTFILHVVALRTTTCKRANKSQPFKISTSCTANCPTATMAAGAHKSIVAARKEKVEQRAKN